MTIRRILKNTTKNNNIHLLIYCVITNHICFENEGGSLVIQKYPLAKRFYQNLITLQIALTY